MLPFPNDFWRVDGKLALSDETFPKSRPVLGSVPVRAAAGGWNELDGFTVFPGITTYFPRLTDQSIDNMARVWNPQLSLENPDNPSVILDTATQERVAHWAEVDHMSDQDATLPPEEQAKRALLLWPTNVLSHATTYIVALRRVTNADGELVQPSPGFAALRDGLPSADPLIEERRQQYEEQIFPALASAGVARDELQLAWAFTTASLSGTTSRVQAARDDAFARIIETAEGGGVDYEIDSVEENPFADTRRRITGRFAVPLYLSDAASTPESRLVLDPVSGEPEFQGFAWWPFQVRKRHFLSTLTPVLNVKMIILPRQARDKHRKNSKTSAVFFQLIIPASCGGEEIRLNGGLSIPRSFHRNDRFPKTGSGQTQTMAVFAGLRSCRPTQLGHGLFGSYTQVSSGYARVPAEQFGYITFMCDMVGMASADSITAALVLGSDLTNWVRTNKIFFPQLDTWFLVDLSFISL
jgi:hypothetical protein